MNRLTQVLLLVTAFLLLGGLGGVVSFAFFTSVATNQSNDFVAGTVVISNTPVMTFITNTNMAPGDSVIAQLTVTNSGTLALRYAMITTVEESDGLSDQLVLTIKTKTANPCSSFDGTQLYTGAARSGAIGSPAPGGQTGDRTLAASASDLLCFKVQLPLNTANSYQGATTRLNFEFDAEQTANNP